MAWAVAINSTSNEEFPVKALEDQQKSPCCIYYMISKVIFLGHCVKMKYSYQKWMEEVVCKGLTPYINARLTRHLPVYPDLMLTSKSYLYLYECFGVLKEIWVDRL